MGNRKSILREQAGDGQTKAELITCKKGNQFPSMTRRVVVSLVGGFGITAGLGLLSALSIKFMPYRDLPMMPKPFFLFALSPGVITAELIDGPRWIHEGVFWTANMLAYAIGVFAFSTLLHSRKANRSISKR